MSERLRVSAPGRICLFGEHQDYLHLAIVPAAISLRLTIEGNRRDDDRCVVALPDIHGLERLSINSPLPYTHEQDYFRSAVVVLRPLLTEHHRVLRDVQRVSTPKIDRMFDAALHLLQHEKTAACGEDDDPLPSPDRSLRFPF